MDRVAAGQAALLSESARFRFPALLIFNSFDHELMMRDVTALPIRPCLAVKRCTSDI